MARRALLVCGLLAALAVPPGAVAADETRIKILRECQTGRLTGDYTAREIRDARSNIPDDIDQYSDCRDVLTAALLSRAGGNPQSGGTGGPGLGGPAGTGGPGATGGTGGGGGDLLTPSTDADREALETARGSTATPVDVGGTKVTPGAVGASRNALPSTLIVLLALLGAAAVAALAPVVRRRGLAPVRAVGPALRRVIPRRSA